VKTYSVKKSDIKRQWHVIDASDKVLGRLATQVASLLMGKHKPMFSRHLDTGDFVVVINADKVRLTGNKARQKVYYRHSGYPGGLKSVSFEEMMQTHPTRVIEHAVKGMLPHNRPVSYTHLRAHETLRYLVCRLLLEKKKHRRAIVEPFLVTESLDKYNAVVKVEGGGISGQSGAISHGIARALVKADESVKPVLRQNGLLTRDSRVKERKKVGLKRARKAPQYTKR